MAEADGALHPLSDLPESCLARVLACLDAAELCKVATVCREWQVAARSNAVWEKLLPNGALTLFADLRMGPSSDSSLRELYKELKKGILLQDGQHRVGIDATSGSLAYAVSPAKGLGVANSGSVSYWIMEQSLERSHFDFTAHLISVCWFQISGTVQCKLPPGSYAIKWRLARDVKRRPASIGGRLMLPGPGAGRGVIFKWPSGMADSKLTFENGSLIQEEFVVNEKSMGVLPEWTEVEVGKLMLESKKGERLCDLKMEVDLRELDPRWKTGLYVDALVIVRL